MLSDIIFYCEKKLDHNFIYFFLRRNGGESLGKGRERILFFGRESLGFSKERGFPKGYDSLFMVVTFCAKSHSEPLYFLKKMIPGFDKESKTG